MLFRLGLTCYVSHFILTSEALAEKTTCPLNSFLSWEGCLLCKKCNHFSIVRSVCTETSDTECVTCAGVEEALQRPECRRCPPCPPGEFVAVPCTKHHSTICKKCPAGSFHPKRSYSELCIPCTYCEGSGKEEVMACTSYSDTVCGICDKGFYKEHGSGKCVPCRTCIGKRQNVIKKCLRDGMGRKLCGRQLEYVYHHKVHEANNAWERNGSGQLLLKSMMSYRDTSEKETTTPDKWAETTIDPAPEKKIDVLLHIAAVLSSILVIFMLLLTITTRRIQSKGKCCRDTKSEVGYNKSETFNNKSEMVNNKSEMVKKKSETVSKIHMCQTVGKCVKEKGLFIEAPISAI